MGVVLALLGGCASNPSSGQPAPIFNGAVSTAVGVPATTEREIGQLDTAIALAKEKGLLVLLEFDEFSSANSRRMESQVFTSPEVVEMMGSRFVHANLYTDDKTALTHAYMTPQGSNIRTWGQLNGELKAEVFETSATPFFAILTPEGNVLGTLYYEPNPEAFLRWLQHSADIAKSPGVGRNATQREKIAAHLARERSQLEGTPIDPDEETPTIKVSRSNCTLPIGGPTLAPQGIMGAKSTWKVKAEGTPCPGQKVTLTFTAKPDAGWHLYSASESGEIAYKPTALVIYEEQSSGASLSGKMKDLTAPKEEMDELMGGLIRHYANGEAASFAQQISITGPDPCISGMLDGQVCQDDGQCIPLRIAFTWRPGPDACK